MPDSILDVSRDFFHEIVQPILQRDFPNETAQMTVGIFGYGSEVMRLDDEYSQDHHWGLRVNALLPKAIFEARHSAIEETVSAALPSHWRGHALREGYTQTKGISLSGLEDHFINTIGIAHPPRDNAEWLSIPEEDIAHIVAGEIWQDPLGQFSAVRDALNAYYPEPVRIRRIAHWCRFFSGMGVYALKRAILRNNELYCNTTFSKAIRLGVQLAFLLDKEYFPYDKWLLTFFRRLPRMAGRMGAQVDEAIKLSTSWERKLVLLEQISDVLDETLVEDGLIAPHPKLHGSATSGYRIMERAYAELIKKCPPELKTVVPVWDQIYMERFHSGYVDGIDMATWEGLLNLSPS